MAPNKKIPLRMCVSCRAMKDKREMLRVVKSPEGDVRTDESGKAAGRVAYVCGGEECLKKMRKTRALARAFGCAVEDSVYDAVEGYFSRKKNDQK